MQFRPFPLFSAPVRRTAWAAASAAMLATAAAPALAQDILARVISSTPVVQQFSVPRQVCDNQVLPGSRAPTSGAGAVMGAIAGGAAGNAVGGGSGRALATVIGLVGGAVLGNTIEGGGVNNSPQVVSNCSIQNFYENRVSHYNVVYDYQGTQSSVQMPNDPGQYLRLQVTPVGGYNTYPQQQPSRSGQIQQQTPEIRPQMFNAPPPQVYYYPQQPAFIEQQRIYVQPLRINPTFIEPQVIVLPGTVHQRRHYAPQNDYYQPYRHPAPGLSLNFGYSRSNHR